MAHRLLRAGDAFWRPSNQMSVLNTDLGKQLVLLEGSGRVRVEGAAAGVGSNEEGRMRIGVLGTGAVGRATEMYLPLWLRLYQHVGTADFNIAIAR